MGEAYDQIRRVAPDYYQAVQLYARVREQFLQTGRGATAQFLERYQSIYVEELRASNVFTPDEGEAALAGARLSRVPLSHAQPVAEKLKDIVPEDDPLWQATYECTLDGKETRSTLRDIFHNTAQKTLVIPGRRRTARRSLQYLYQLRLVRMRGVEDHQRRRTAWPSSAAGTCRANTSSARSTASRKISCSARP